MDKIYRKTNLKNGIAWVQLINGLTWKSDFNMAVHRWLIYGIYDAPFIYWVKKMLQRKM